MSLPASNMTTMVDLATCAREAIHIPGSIQPHGILLALSADDLTIVQASANVEWVLSLPISKLLGQRLADVAPEIYQALASDLQKYNQKQSLQFLRMLELKAGRFDAAVHASGEMLVLELEQTADNKAVSLDELYPVLRGFVEGLQDTYRVVELCALAAQNVRSLTNFDRVLIYRFDEEWNGTVIAEDRNEELPSYLDLRFPASDIPQQARELYRKNRFRLIPDATYIPVPLIPALNPKTNQPLDLSLSVLRSVSPVHVEYMQNMGTAASMSFSILHEGRLWGLISCHNRLPRQTSLHVRNACDFLAQILSLQIAAREQTKDVQYRIELSACQSRLLGFMAATDHFIDGLTTSTSDLLRLTAADGAAVISGDECVLAGATPSKEQVRELVAWLSEHHREDVFWSDNLSSVLPEAREWSDLASGVLTISISKMHASYIIWFRPEAVRTVTWGGDPNKSVEQAGNDTRLHPRKSFDIWKETVRFKSLPWKKSEIDAAKELRNTIVGIVLHRAEELAGLSEELQRSNKELEAFSYSVSHDLRAPFRHIVGYSELLREKDGERLTERGRRYVDTIIESARSAGTLVDSLLSFSQMGRTSLSPRKVDMVLVVTDIRRRLMNEVGDRLIEWRIGDLAPMHADPVMLRLAVENLLSNAVKYTRNREHAVLEIGSQTNETETIFFVRDNGVGFDMNYIDKLFGVFQRLHRIEEFEGTGIGLANVKRIVERHGGRVWAEGAVDKGATFFFSLPHPVDAI